MTTGAGTRARSFGKGEPAVSAALAGGASYADAAKAGGVSLSTVTRRMADPEYAARVASLRSELLQRAVGRLAESAELAADCLRDLLSSPSDQAKLGAARAILEFSGRFYDLADLEQRIASLEAEKEGTTHDTRRDQQRTGQPADGGRSDAPLSLRRGGAAGVA